MEMYEKNYEEKMDVLPGGLQYVSLRLKYSKILAAAQTPTKLLS